MIKLNYGGNNHGEKKKAKINIRAIFLLAVCLCFLPVVSAETYKPGTVDLKFTCTLNNAIPSSSATYNITLSYLNGTILIDNQVATPQGQGLFNYTTNLEINEYVIHSFCYDGVYSYSNEEYFNVKSTSLTFLIFLYGLAIIFFVATLIVDEEFLVYISGVLFLVGGIYIMINGLEDLNDMYSRAISFVSLGIGLLFTLGAYIFNSYSGRIEESEEY